MNRPHWASGERPAFRNPSLDRKRWGGVSDGDAFPPASIDGSLPNERLMRVLETLLLLVIHLLSVGAVAQGDAKISLRGTELVGLPYEKAELDLANTRLRIGDKELQFTPYLKDFFKRPQNVEITASWKKREADRPSRGTLIFWIPPKANELGRMLRFNMDKDH
jgi:hypothetical protein